jgi:hypothetical protein
MKHKLHLLVAAMVVALLSFASIGSVNAKDITSNIRGSLCDSVSISGAECPDPDPNKLEATVSIVIEYALWAVGAIAVIFLIIGGITFAVSGGDAEKVKKAKSTVLYSIIGLSLAILANVIVRLVVKTTTDELFK